jgi:hypothetical protein
MVFVPMLQCINTSYPQSFGVWSLGRPVLPDDSLQGTEPYRKSVPNTQRFRRKKECGGMLADAVTLQQQALA